MIIPDFLEKNDTIGVTACSCGILHKVDKYEKSIKKFIDRDYKILETDNVRTDGIVSSDINTRVKELEDLVSNKDVKMINIASGGDFLCEILSYVNYDLIRRNIKWFGGSSDPTSLLHIITTNLDMATIYTPCNMSGYSSDLLDQSYLDYFEIIKGNLVKQYKSSYYEDKDDIFDQVNDWESYGEDINCEGRLIGGCIESLKDLIGTDLDKTLSYIEKYKDDRIIWYFDVFGFSSEDLYRTLLQFKNAGWFKYTDLIVIGKVKYPQEIDVFPYDIAIKKALTDYKVIYKFDIGHVKPSMTMINGMKAKIIFNDDEGSLEYLK